MSLMFNVGAVTRRLRRATGSRPQSECFEVIYVDHELKEHSVTVDTALELKAALEQIREQGGYPRYVVRSLY